MEFTSTVRHGKSCMLIAKVCCVLVSPGVSLGQKESKLCISIDLWLFLLSDCTYNVTSCGGSTPTVTVSPETVTNLSSPLLLLCIGSHQWEN